MLKCHVEVPLCWLASFTSCIISEGYVPKMMFDNGQTNSGGLTKSFQKVKIWQLKIQQTLNCFNPLQSEEIYHSLSNCCRCILLSQPTLKWMLVLLLFKSFSCCKYWLFHLMLDNWWTPEIWWGVYVWSGYAITQWKINEINGLSDIGDQAEQFNITQ